MNQAHYLTKKDRLLAQTLNQMNMGEIIMGEIEPYKKKNVSE